MVRVKLYGSVRKLAETPELNLTIREGMVLKDLIRQVVGDTAESQTRLISAILVNGRNCAFRKGLETEIADGDLVEMLPIVTGG
jgi:molybdopterin converting factor small subunit